MSWTQRFFVVSILKKAQKYHIFVIFLGIFLKWKTKGFIVAYTCSISGEKGFSHDRLLFVKQITVLAWVCVCVVCIVCGMCMWSCSHALCVLYANLIFVACMDCVCVIQHAKV